MKTKALMLNSILISHYYYYYSSLLLLLMRSTYTFRASVTKVLRRVALAACVLLLIQELLLHPSLTYLHGSLLFGPVTVPPDSL